MTEIIRPSAWLEAPNGDRLPLTSFNSIGRSSKNSLVLDNHTVSRRHALIQAQGVGEHWLVDLGSSNGTRLNDLRVTHPARLQNSDVIEIGGRIYRFQRADPNPAATPSHEPHTASGWLLVTNIRDFSQLSQTVPPDTLAPLTGGWFKSGTSIIQSHFGAINQYLGDGFFAWWTEGDQVAGHVLAAVTDLRQLQGQANPAFRLALHYGEITMGGVSAVGGESMLGKEVDFLLRMEEVAAEMKLDCLFSDAAARKLEGAEKLMELPRRPVPGFDGTFNFFTI